MKKGTITRIFASLAATFATTFLFAQDQNLIAANRFKPEQSKAITTIYNKPASSTATVYVKAKVMRSFLDSFRDAYEVQWSGSNSRYFASFKQEGRWCKALFDGKGGLVFSIRYSTEKDLPHDVRKQLKSTYIDYAIGAVTEINTDNLNAWVVNLSDGDNLIVVSVADGAMYELHQYKTHF